MFILIEKGGTAMWNRVKGSRTVVRMILFFDALLMVGSIAYAAMANIADAIYPLGRLSVEEGMERLNFLMARDNVLAVTVYVYLIGQVLCGCIIVWKKLQVFKVKTCLTYYASQLLLAFICAVPFALASERSIYDYTGPVFGIAGNLALLIVIFYFSFKTRMRINATVDSMIDAK